MTGSDTKERPVVHEGSRMQKVGEWLKTIGLAIAILIVTLYALPEVLDNAGLSIPGIVNAITGWDLPLVVKDEAVPWGIFVLVFFLIAPWMFGTRAAGKMIGGFTELMKALAVKIRGGAR